MKTQQSEYNNKTFRGAVQRDSNVVGERFWRDFSIFYFNDLLKSLHPYPHTALLEEVTCFQSGISIDTML